MMIRHSAKSGFCRREMWRACRYNAFVFFSDDEGSSVLTIAFDARTHVLRQQKLLYFYRSGASVEETETYTDIALNSALSANVFSFVPPHGAVFDQKFSDLLRKLPPDYDEINSK